MLRRWDRIQHAIIESFPSRGSRPVPIWNLYELEPDHDQRSYLQRKIAKLGVGEHDFLRWRNACIAYDLPKSLSALKTMDDNYTPMATPLWVTCHLLRRKVYTSSHASMAAHLALVAVPASGPLTPADEQPLLLALDVIAKYSLVHALPALTSRILALPTRHHAKLLTALCKLDLPPSPLAAASLQMVLDDLNARLILLPNEVWQSVWEKWVVLHPLGDDFTTSLRLQIRQQGFRAPEYRNFDRSRTYTQSATDFPHRTTPSRGDPSLAVLTAAAHSKQVTSRFLLGIASALADGLFPRHPSRKQERSPAPSATFLTALMLGLIRKGAYSPAVGVWQNVQKSEHKIFVTPKLLEAAVSAYILNGNIEDALKLLDTHSRTWLKFSPDSNAPDTGVRLQPKLLTLLISHLPPAAQGLAFREAYRRWGIQPDSSALEAVMVGASQAVAKQSLKGQDLRSNMRELREGIRNIFRGAQVPIEQPEPTILLPGPFEKRHAIRVFHIVLLRNWPFIQGAEGHWKGLLDKRTIELFIPTPLTVSHSTLDSAPDDDDFKPRPGFEFTPSPLHPSPTPAYPHACPTRRAWTAYLSLLDPEYLPQSLAWMRSADEFLHMRPASTGSPLDLFRPERAALIDVLMRWEDAVLSGETPVGRAWEERKKVLVEGVGREGALRAWLIEWLGDECVPSRSEIARARINGKD